MKVYMKTDLVVVVLTLQCVFLPLSAQLSVFHPENDQYYPSVCFMDVDYLVVWSDDRNGLTNTDIYGTRVSQSGIVLDTGGICITDEQRIQIRPSVAFDGTNCLVVWSDRRVTAPGLYGTRVNQAGGVLDSNGIAIMVEGFAKDYPSVVFEDTSYLVVWAVSDGWMFFDIQGRRVSQSVGLTGVLNISFESNDQIYPSVAFDGTNSMVVWLDARVGWADIYGSRVSQCRPWILDPAGINITPNTHTSNQYYPSIAFDGQNYMVVWHDNRISWLDIMGSRVSPSGMVLDSAGINITPNTAGTIQEHPAIACGGLDYMVVWADNRDGSDFDIYGARINAEGLVLDTAGIAVSSETGDQNNPSIAFDGTNYLAVWTDERNGTDRDIYGARISQGGVVLDTQGIAISLVGIEEDSQSTLNDLGYGLVIHPNPFRHHTNIRLKTTDVSSIGIKIYDVSGRFIKLLPMQPEGFDQQLAVQWDGTDQDGMRLPGGVYFLTLTVGDYSATEKMLLIR